MEMNRIRRCLLLLGSVYILGSTLSLHSAADPVLVGAGDIASCTSAGDEATAKLLDQIDGTVFTLGDNVYEAGTATEFTQCYEPSWGRHKSRTRPAVGNHEYFTPEAQGYFNYFGNAAGDPLKGYYSYDIGTWHVVVLNSVCGLVGGCDVGSLQERWLRADLAAHPTSCLIAYWHHPRSTMQALTEDLYEAGVDIVLNGHLHYYERFLPQNAGDVADPNHGFRKFIVGTGGRGHGTLDPASPLSEVRNNDTFGVLKLTLHATSYDWNFIPEAGKMFSDAGQDTCSAVLQRSHVIFLPRIER
jgi:predicted phosphodiesterase